MDIKKAVLWFLGGIFLLSFISNIIGGKNMSNDENKTMTLDEKKFYWDDKTLPYKNILVPYVNRLHNEMEECQNIQVGTLSLSSSKGTKNDPVFYITCGKDENTHNVFFRKSEIEHNTLPKSVDQINQEKYEMIARGENMLKHMMRDPDSFDILNSVLANDTTVCYTYRAKNGFGGLSVENAIYSDGLLYVEGSDGFQKKWNKHCR